jgi:hypothetical protein
MKGHVLYVIIFLSGMLLIGCSDDQDGNPDIDGAKEYYIRFNADGENYLIDDQPTILANISSSSMQFIGTFSGFNTGNGISLSMQVFDGKSITDTIYNAYTNMGTYYYGALISYIDDDGKQYGSGFPSDANVVIDSITAVFVKGTFAGNVSELSGPATSTITSGEFRVKRVY